MTPERISTWSRRLFFLSCVIALAAIGVADSAHAQSATGTVRVAPTGSDMANCGSIAAPCRTLQYANDQFPLGATGTILVAAGTYTSSDPRQVLRITQRTITLQGGYTTAFTAPNYAANVVKIDGQKLRKGLLVDCPVGSPNPCQLTLAGITLANCNAGLDPGTLNAFGGGLDAYLANLALLDIVFTGNQASANGSTGGLPGDAGGGALSIRESTATLTRVRFENNRAVGGSGTPNSTRGGLGVGGAIFSYDSTLTITDATAIGNLARAGDAPGAVGISGGQRADGLGGFLALIRGIGTQTITRLSGRDNSAEGGDAVQYGGLGLGGAIFIQIAPLVVAKEVALSDNTAIGGAGDASLGGGGSIFAEDVHLELDRGSLIGNLAQGANGTNVGGTGGGGGIYMNAVTTNSGLGTDLLASNLIVAKNAAIAGTGITKGFAFGGGIFVQCPGGPGVCNANVTTNTADLSHVTLADNTVTGADYNQGGALWVGLAAVVDMSFSIVSGHATPAVPSFDRGEAVLTWGATTFASTLWNGNTMKAFAVPPNGSFVDGAAQNGLPYFVAPNGASPNYHIQSNSAARNAAAGSTIPKDLDGDDRNGAAGVPDLGADEFVVPEPDAACTGAVAIGLIAALRCRRQRV
jgi:hypothetical protein